MLKNIIYKLLRSSEKYTHTDMVYLAKGGSWLMSTNMVTMLLSLLSAILFANILTKDDYGSYKYILSILNILYISTLPGLGTAITQSYGNDKKVRLDKIKNVKIKWGLIGTIACLILAAYYLYVGKDIIAYSLFAASIVLPFINTFNIYGSFFHGIKQFGRFAKYNIITQVLGNLAIIAALVLSENIFIILVTNLFVYTLIRYLIYRRINAENKLPASDDIVENEKQTITYGKKMSVVNIINTIADNLDQIIIFRLLGPANLAIYAIALAPIQHMKKVLLNMKTLALPKFAATEDGVLKKNIKDKIVKTYVVILPIIVVYILVAPFLFKILFPEYEESVLITQLLSVTLAFMPRVILGAALESKKKAKDLFASKTIGSIIKIISLLVLVNYFGIMGLIASLVIYEFFIFLLFYRSVTKI